ncbi:hypothetical protein QE152_g37333 [Popillia japonica]|uniref:Uncharacterized protein n=1 Tax=Popillia japonica TaxID=7064 RepID=A0AAW1IAT6_POPJA
MLSKEICGKCAESGKGVIVEYFGGLFTNTFPLLLPGVMTTGISVNSDMPEGKVSIFAKEMAHMKQDYKFVDKNEEAQNFWKDTLDRLSVSNDEDT